MSKIITTNNGTIIGEHLAENLIDYYYECTMNNLDSDYFIESSIYRFPSLRDEDYLKLDEFNKNHNTAETFKQAILDTAQRCNCVTVANEYLKSKGL